MRFIKKIIGKAIYGLARFIDIILGLIIDFLNVIVNLIYGLGKGILRFFRIGMLLLMMLLVFPLGILFISPILIQVIFIFFIIPLISKQLSKGLIFIKYVITEYLYDKANYYMDGSSMRFENIKGYAREFRRMEDEKRRKAEEAERARREEEQRRFEEYMRNARWSSFNTGGYQSNNSTGNGFNNMGFGFKEDYEKACDVLGVNYNASKDEIKVAYRKKAKEYHPDLNKSEGATEMFQKVNDANEFLSEDNINRYKNIS